MATDTDIANQALLFLGEKQIGNINDDTKQAKAAKLYLPQARDEVLQRHTWSRAIFYRQLTNTGNSVGIRWTNEYNLPADTLRLIELYRSKEPHFPPLEDFEITGSTVWTNTEVAYCKVVERIPSADLTPLMVDAVATLLAAKLCLLLTGSNQDQVILYQKAEQAISQAIFRDAQQSRSGENSARRRNLRFGLVNARRGSGRISDRYD